MSDLFKLLFEDLPEPDDEVMRILEAAERVEKLEVKKKPLKDALDDLHIEDVELQATPDGMLATWNSDASFHADTKRLGLPGVITQLAGHGWVPVCGGDTRPGDESPSYTWKFLEVDDVPYSTADVGNSSEDDAVTAAKFNGFAAQDQKVTQPPMQGNARGLEKGKKKDESVVPEEKPFDTVSFVMAFEDGSLPEDEVVAGFQHLIDNGTVWQLQGTYGRTAANLIRQGLCTDTHHVLGRGRSPQSMGDADDARVVPEESVRRSGVADNAEGQFGPRRKTRIAT